MTTSLWLELKFEQATKVFELAPEDDRVVVVGSLLRADVRVDRVGVKPVHFQFERVGNDLLLNPVYGSDVRIGSNLISEPPSLPRIALLEFAGVSMRVRVLKELPLLTGDETILDGSSGASDWANHDAATVIAPPVRTADPMITVRRPDDDEAEVTEVIPPPATRRPEPPRPGHCVAPPQGAGSPLRESGSPTERNSRRPRSLAAVAAASLVVLLALVAIAGIVRMCAAS